MVVLRGAKYYTTYEEGSPVVYLVVAFQNLRTAGVEPSALLLSPTESIEYATLSLSDKTLGETAVAKNVVVTPKFTTGSVQFLLPGVTAAPTIDRNFEITETLNATSYVSPLSVRGFVAPIAANLTAMSLEGDTGAPPNSRVLNAAGEGGSGMLICETGDATMPWYSIPVHVSTDFSTFIQVVSYPVDESDPENLRVINLDGRVATLYVSDCNDNTPEIMFATKSYVFPPLGMITERGAMITSVNVVRVGTINTWSIAINPLEEGVMYSVSGTPPEGENNISPTLMEEMVPFTVSFAAVVDTPITVLFTLPNFTVQRHTFQDNYYNRAAVVQPPLDYWIYGTSDSADAYAPSNWTFKMAKADGSTATVTYQLIATDETNTERLYPAGGPAPLDTAGSPAGVSTEVVNLMAYGSVLIEINVDGVITYHRAYWSDTYVAFGNVPPAQRGPTPAEHLLNFMSATLTENVNSGNVDVEVTRSSDGYNVTPSRVNTAWVYMVDSNSRFVIMPMDITTDSVNGTQVFHVPRWVFRLKELNGQVMLKLFFFDPVFPNEEYVAFDVTSQANALFSADTLALSANDTHVQYAVPWDSGVGNSTTVRVTFVDSGSLSPDVYTLTLMDADANVLRYETLSGSGEVIDISGLNASQFDITPVYAHPLKYAVPVTVEGITANCFTGDTLLLRGDGCAWVRARDVRAGDTLRTHDGRSVPVSHVRSHNARPLSTHNVGGKPLQHTLYAIPREAGLLESSDLPPLPPDLPLHAHAVSYWHKVWDARTRAWTNASKVCGAVRLTELPTDACVAPDGTFKLFNFVLPDYAHDTLVMAHGIVSESLYTGPRPSRRARIVPAHLTDESA